MLELNGFYDLNTVIYYKHYLNMSVEVQSYILLNN